MNELRELRPEELTAIEGGLGVVGFAGGLVVIAAGAFAIGYIAGQSDATKRETENCKALIEGN